MNVPTTWANPYRLKMIREKNSKVALKYTNENHSVQTENSRKTRTFSWFSLSFAFGR